MENLFLASPSPYRPPAPWLRAPSLRLSDFLLGHHISHSLMSCLPVIRTLVVLWGRTISPPQNLSLKHTCKVSFAMVTHRFRGLGFTHLAGRRGRGGGRAGHLSEGRNLWTPKYITHILFSPVNGNFSKL